MSRYRARALAASLAMLLFAQGPSFADAPAYRCGDRQPPVHCVYPERVFLHNGGHVIDVTKPPFNAKGDGVTDDTAALVRAYDFVLARADEAGWGGGGPLAEDDYILYLPHGTYLVSDTVIYSSPPRVGREPNRWEQVARVRFVGESREGTTIRLKDDCPGFGRGAGRPVLSFGKSDFNNHKAFTAVRNLTIDTGSGNPGAVGLDFMGANLAELRNVAIRSGDGRGDTGLRLPIAPTVGVHRDITVEGFDYGLRLTLGSRATHPVFEHFTLRRQAKVGVRLEQGASTSIRKLRSDNRATAVEIASPAAHLVLLDSELIGGDAGAAINLLEGQLFARDVKTSGYSAALRQKGRNVVAGSSIDEYVSGSAVATGAGEEACSLRLPAEDIPETPWFADLLRWACPEDFGAQADGSTDDTAAIQAALDSGKPMIYFPNRRYATSGVLRVPASVRRVNGLFHSLRMTFEVADAADHEILFEDFSHAAVRLSSARPVMVSLADWAHYTNASGEPGARLHLCGAHGLSRRSVTRGMLVWARSINSEGRSLPFHCEGADMWVLGFKSERAPLVWEVTGSSRLEILGGTFGVAHPDTWVIHDASAVSMTANSSGFRITGKEKVVVGKTPGGEHIVSARQLPPRPDGNDNLLIPLYVHRP